MYSTIALVALLGATSATPIAKLTKFTPRQLDNSDFQLINLARNLESLELNYWNQGLENFTEEDFNNAGYEGFRTFLELFRDQEVAHFTALNDAAGGGFDNCTYVFPVSTPEEFISLGQVVTTVGEGAFIGASGLLSDPNVRQTGAEIIGNEARQNSYLRQTLGLNYFNAPNFDTPLTAPQAYSLAKPFLDCPASNPPIKFTEIPPLNASFTNDNGTHGPGDEIQIAWDANSVYLGDDVFITFLSDKLAEVADLTQTSDGQGTVQLPEGINGTAILVATNYDGPSPIPDGQNFAIGYLVIA